MLQVNRSCQRSRTICDLLRRFLKRSRAGLAFCPGELKLLNGELLRRLVHLHALEYLGHLLQRFVIERLQRDRTHGAGRHLVRQLGVLEAAETVAVPTHVCLGLGVDLVANAAGEHVLKCLRFDAGVLARLFTGKLCVLALLFARATNITKICSCYHCIIGIGKGFTLAFPARQNTSLRLKSSRISRRARKCYRQVAEAAHL